MLNEAQAIAKALSGIQATMSWLELRGVKRSEVMRILNIAEAAGRDVSEGEIIQVLDATDTELLNLRQKIALDRGIELPEVEMADLLEARAFADEEQAEADVELAAKALAKKNAPKPTKAASKKSSKKAEPTPEEIKAALEKAKEDATKD